MKSHAEEQETIRQYLLGLLPPEELPLLEERLLTDSAFYEELLIVEDEIIDEYFAGELSQPERESFETHFLLAPERQEKARFARTLKKYVSAAGAAQPREDIAIEEASEDASEVGEPPPKKQVFFSFLPFQNPIFSYSFATAVLLVVVGVSWVVLKNWRNPTPHQPGNVLTVVLTPGLTRDGGEIKKISISAETDSVRFRLGLAENYYPQYRAILLSDSLSQVWTGDHVRANTTDNLAEADVPAYLLSAGDYQIKLSGQLANGSFEDVASYRFRVVR